MPSSRSEKHRTHRTHEDISYTIRPTKSVRWWAAQTPRGLADYALAKATNLLTHSRSLSRTRTKSKRKPLSQRLHSVSHMQPHSNKPPKGEGDLRESAPLNARMHAAQMGKIRARERKVTVGLASRGLAETAALYL